MSLIKNRLVAKFLTVSLLFSSNVQAQDKDRNIALNKPVSANSEVPKNPAKNVVDGKISRNSRWVASTNRAPHILEINLQKYHVINEIRVHSGIMDAEKRPDEMSQAAGFWSLKNFKLQYWDDANWSDFPKSEVLENRLTSAAFKFSPSVTTFKVRLICDDGEPVNIMEIEVFGREALNMPAPPVLGSEMRKAPAFTGSRKATVTVNNKEAGKSMKFVGYNQGYYFPGSNVSGWLEYSNVNSVRVWATLNSFVPEKSVQVDKNVRTVEEFDKRKTQLRSDPENNRFIKWTELNPLYDKPDSSSTNAMIYNYAITELKRLGIQTILQLGSTDFKDTWENKWKQWQRYYAIAYHSAKTGDVAMFAMQNEPNHRHSGPMKLDQWIMGMQVTSDAIHAAVEDVNKKYGKKLEARFVGPVTAGQNTDWWAAVSKAIRTDYHGKTVDKDLLNIFSTHSYNSPAAGYQSRINNIRKIITDNHPKGQALPIVYTEIGRWMNAYLIDKEETMDSPSLFTEWAGIYSNNMKNGGYGMWAFKFANTASSTYPRGIKSGHHYIWQGKRIVEDAYRNIALNKPVRSNQITNSAGLVTDGDKSDKSVWIADSLSTEKWVEVDLLKEQLIGSAVVYTGSAYGVYTSPDRIKNFKLQYLSAGSWKDIPGASEKECRYSQVFTVFKQPVKASKVRFISTDKGRLKVREIKLFAAGDGPKETSNYNVSGIQRTGEVVRLFAKGFKNERPLLETRVSVSDHDLDTYTSYDEKSGNYYMWLVQRGLFDYNLSVNLASLNVFAGTPVTAETVSADYYGELNNIDNLGSDKTFNLILRPQSVVLLTIPSGKVKKEVISALAEKTVFGARNSVANRAGDRLQVQLDASKPEDNKVSYIYFDMSPSQIAASKKIVLGVNGQNDGGERPYRLHVYGIPSQFFNLKELSETRAPLLDVQQALISEVGRKAFVAGELAFDSVAKYHHLDVTDMLKKHAGEGVAFVFIRETRQLGDDEDKGRKVFLNSLKSDAKPMLEIWTASK
ncbi:discoidin domain-containing protein [Desertivirga xinjiangensis]|uniref:discoidin domain-containing protein n=1 Tax=Desertivirga xinjiangensis TaxID=539206 RepID=UPI00210B610F|nr:discoidin domain-containing protein [Pedobacter xinjiangensis]